MHILGELLCRVLNLALIDTFRSSQITFLKLVVVVVVAHRTDFASMLWLMNNHVFGDFSHMIWQVLELTSRKSRNLLVSKL